MSVKMTDINEVLKRKPASYEGHSPANKEWDEYNKNLRYASQRLTDKYAKDHAWTVVNAKWDFENKAIKFEIISNVNKMKTEEKIATYEDICKNFLWKSFKFNENHSSVFPVKLTEDEIKKTFNVKKVVYAKRDNNSSDSDPDEKKDAEPEEKKSTLEVKWRK